MILSRDSPRVRSEILSENARWRPLTLRLLRAAEFPQTGWKLNGPPRSAFSGRPLLEDPPSRPAARRRSSLSPGRMPSPSRRWSFGRFHGNVRAKFVSRAAEAPALPRGIRERLSLNYEPLKRLRVRVLLQPPSPPCIPRRLCRHRGHRRNEFSPLEGNAVSVIRIRPLAFHRTARATLQRRAAISRVLP
jgi:hypothetical protein